jgi:kynurenine formamidase
MRLIDLSHPLVHGQDNFPSDPKLSIIPHGNTSTLRYNMTQVSMATHQGTHLDAMYHFLDDGKTIDQMPLDWFYGDAVLLRIPKAPPGGDSRGGLRPARGAAPTGGEGGFETGWHRRFGTPGYFSDFPSLTQDAARSSPRAASVSLAWIRPRQGGTGTKCTTSCWRVTRRSWWWRA